MAESGAIHERNKTSIRRFVERALNRRDLKVVDATRGEFAEGGKGRIQELRSAFPDLATTIHPIVAEGDWVAHRMVHTGTHLGPFRGIAPTGQRVEFTSIAMNRFHDGIVVENWGCTTSRRCSNKSRPQSMAEGHHGMRAWQDRRRCRTSAHPR